eukprot:6327079-Lingulodinium_polyedra.AAC.1
MLGLAGMLGNLVVGRVTVDENPPRAAQSLHQIRPPETWDAARPSGPRGRTARPGLGRLQGTLRRQGRAK